MAQIISASGPAAAPRGKWLRVAAAASGVALLLGTAACSAKYDPFNPAYDPLVREGLYHPQHINRANLTLQVANPADLVRGSGTAGADGQIAANAVDRLRNDKVKKLPASDLAPLSTSQSGANNEGGQ